jgi:hypothetical protein
MDAAGAMESVENGGAVSHPSHSPWKAASRLAPAHAPSHSAQEPGGDERLVGGRDKENLVVVVNG